MSAAVEQAAFATDWDMVKNHAVEVMPVDRELAIYLGKYEGLEADARSGRYDHAPVMQYIARHARHRLAALAAQTPPLEEIQTLDGLKRLWRIGVETGRILEMGDRLYGKTQCDQCEGHGYLLMGPSTTSAGGEKLRCDKCQPSTAVTWGPAALAAPSQDEASRAQGAWTALMRRCGGAFGSIDSGYLPEVEEMRSALAALSKGAGA